MCEFCNLNIKHEHGRDDFINNQSWGFFSAEAVELACSVISSGNNYETSNSKENKAQAEKNNNNNNDSNSNSNNSNDDDDDDDDGQGDDDEDGT